MQVPLSIHQTDDVNATQNETPVSSPECLASQEGEDTWKEMEKVSPLMRAALQYIANGLSVIPLRCDKTPLFSWSKYQTQRPSQLEIERWFDNPDCQIGFACGLGSGNLEVIDFDEKYNDSHIRIFDEWKELVDGFAPGLVDKLPLESTQHGGFHIFYRCQTIARNSKLARRCVTDKERVGNSATGWLTLVETRGLGGYIMAAPSKGYSILKGSLLNIPTITVEERAILLNAARSLTTYVDAKKVITGQGDLKRDGPRRPGDIYNESADISSLLVEYGWQYLFEREGTEYWRRPGKTIGVSATFNHIPDRFYVFSTNAPPFESETAYSKFAVYTMLQHGGDFQAAATGLRERTVMPTGKDIVSQIKDHLNRNYITRYNIISQRTEIKNLNATDYKELDEHNLNTIYVKMYQQKIEAGIEKLGRILNSEFSAAYNPFLEFCKGLPDWNPTINYIDELLSTLTLKDPTENDLLKEFFKMWLVNLVASMVDVGSVNQNALILVGPQGIGKTRWLNRLVPSELKSYGYVGKIRPDDKDSKILLANSLLINLDELETMNRYDIGLLKSLMTTENIRVRIPYDKYETNVPRRASFVGSINNTTFLKDETGNRRFLVFEVDSIDMIKPIDINGLYSQAYHLYKGGFKFFLNDVDIKRINNRNREYLTITTEDELLGALYEKVMLDENRGAVDPLQQDFVWKTATEIATEVAVSKYYALTPNSAKNFGTALVKAGYCHKKSGGKCSYAVRRKGCSIELGKTTKEKEHFSKN